MDNKVGLVKTDWDATNIDKHISAALDLIDFKPKGSVSSVAIKPNLCYYWNAATGYTTDPRVVAGIIDYVRERFGSDVEIKVVEADASAMRTKYAFPLLGYKRLAEEKKVELLNLSEDIIEERDVEVNGRKISFKVPVTLLKVDFFVNVPKLKVMRDTHITCALKNIFGCIAFPRKVVYHEYLAEAIVGINKILKPHLSLVDGLVALGRVPVRLGLLIAGENPFYVDWVAAQVMGYNPSRIRFLNVALAEKFGDPDDIVVCGEKTETFRRNFPKENNTIFRVKWGLQFALLRAYQRVVGDVVPPVLEDI